MAEGSTTAPEASRRRIIERPRLTRLLDESPARIKMLVAPAGYGKTTLARQWVGLGQRRSTWFVCRRSSADVAALAEGLAVAARCLIPDFGAVVLDRLAATEVPAHELDVLAELMLEELEHWPPDAWLVVDDYHLIGDSPSAEFFFGEVAASPSLNLVILGRTRPAWATARRVIYGEILGVSRDALQMTDTEAHELLNSSVAQAVAGRILGSRWPALLGLAALAGGMPEEWRIPSSVYEFLAEELFASLSAPAREAALAIVGLPQMDRDTARELLGEHAPSVLAEAAAAGMFDVREPSGVVEMHPLIRDFLLTKRDVASDRYAQRLFRILLEKKRWDDAFALVQEFLPSSLEELLRAALPEMLAKARVQTLETWLVFADHEGLTGPACERTTAELALREGSYIEAFTASNALARRLPDGDDMKTHVLLLAGRAAHLASLEQEALTAYRTAKSLAKYRSERRMALWGEILASIDLELPEAEQLLSDANAETDTLVDVICHATRSLMLDVRSGKLRTLSQARALVSSSGRVNDPLLQCSFLNILASNLAVAGEYEDCLEVSELLLSEARRHRLDFVLAYALGTQAICQAGLKDVAEALTVLEEAVLAARRQQDTHAMLNSEAIRSRIYFSLADFEQANTSLGTEVTGAIPSMASEIFACRGLALAALGQIENARSAAEHATRLSSSIETAVLVPGIYAICAATHDPPTAPTAVDRLIEASAESGNLDSLVTIYRGVPDVMTYATGARLPDLVAVMRKMRDDRLESAIRTLSAQKDSAAAILSRRESEVAELLARGYTNKEIASQLFIAPTTAKQHVRHILEKLGVRTRTEAALRLAAMQTRQATHRKRPPAD
jgi:LuxR family transcriptional regulator, maltose regulon positive regulatory protein